VPYRKGCVCPTLKSSVQFITRTRWKPIA